MNVTIAAAPAENSAVAPVRVGYLAVAGDLLEDIVVWHAAEITHATDTTAQIFRTRGGSAANVAAAAAQLTAVRFIGRVGNDPLGSQLEAELQNQGVDVKLQRGGKTGTVVILVDGRGERTMFPDRGAAAEIGPIDPSWLDEVAWLHLPLYGFETPTSARSLQALASDATARQIPVSIDVSSVALLRGFGVQAARDLIDSLAPTIVFVNADEAEFLGTTVTAGERTLVLKRGPLPVRIITASAEHEIAVEPVAVVIDSTGAGDCFAAGFLAALIAGDAIDAAVSAGATSAAKVLGNPGSAPSN